MKNADSHVYLYAKGHYRKGDLIEDMRRIFGKRNCMEAEHILLEDIVHMLLGIVWPHVNNTHYFREFIQDLSPHNYWKLSHISEYVFEYAVIRKCLSVLRMTQVKEGDEVLIELDDPDPDILPLTKHANGKEG